jgi:ribosome maturation factor RimP
LADIPALTALIEPEARALGFALVRVALFGAGEERTLQIMAERPDTRQLTIEDCASLSHRISDKLDALEEQGRDPIEGAYRLEVSSPGIDRPLTRLSDFADWAGHEAKVQLATPLGEEQGGRKALHGIVTGVEGETIAFEDRKAGPVRFRLDDVAGAKLLLTDRLIAATRPLDVAGAEEEEIAADLDVETGQDDTGDEVLANEQDA